MKGTFALFALYLALIPAAMALEPIIGKQFYYSPSGLTEAFSLELDSHGTGLLTGRLGTTPITWRAENGALQITTTTDAFTYTGYEVLEKGGLIQLVQVDNTLRTLTFREANGFISAEYKNDLRYTYKDSAGQDHVEYGSETSTRDGFIRETRIGESSPARVRFRFQPGMRVTLPMGPDGMSSALVELGENGEGKVLMGPLALPKTFKWSLAQEGRELSISWSGNGTLDARITGVSFDGHDGRVLVELAPSTVSAKLHQDIVVLDNPQASDITAQEVAGVYSAFFKGDEVSATFNFGADGILSATIMDNVIYISAARWEVRNGKLIIQQYRIYDQAMGRHRTVNNADELLACEAKTADCFVNVRREYQILDRRGDTFVFVRDLRWMEMGQSFEHADPSIAVQYFTRK